MIRAYRTVVLWMTTTIGLWAAALLALALAVPGIIPPAAAGILLGTAAGMSVLLILRTRSRLDPARQAADAANHALLASSRLTLKPIERLRLLPLVEFAPGDPALATTFAVSYYVETGQDRILFDLGIKLWEEEEAVLYRNARSLADQGRFSLDQVACIVNSHAHNDHLAARPNETILAEADNPLHGKSFHAVDPLDVRGGGLQIVEKPTLLSPTAGLTGPLRSELFLAGPTREQSLVFHLAGRGLVVIIGCGHPGVRLIVQASQQIFGQPVWGLVGGLHYPVTADRTGMGRVFHPQQLIGGPESYPWQGISRQQVDADIAFLQERGVRWVALSAHDSCDWALQRFLDSPLDAQIIQTGRDILLGEETVIDS